MKLTTIIIAMMLASKVVAQTEAIDTARFVAIYDYECRTQDETGTPVTGKMQLAVQVGRHTTKSMPATNYQPKENKSKEDIIAGFDEAMLHMPTVWTGWPEGQTTVREFIHPHDFEGYEPVPDIRWTLLDDTLTVCGYPCKTATTTHRGIVWHVCYTEDVPSSAGPWRLRGLPGLILKAESEAHTFCLSELRQEASHIMAPAVNPDVQRMTYDKLLKHKNRLLLDKRYPKNPNYYMTDLMQYVNINNMVILNYEGPQQYPLVNGHPLLMKANVYQPLEIE